MAEAATTAGQPADRFTPVPVLYTNWRGVTRERQIVPVAVRFGADQWHPKPQHILDALDAETGEYRGFALAGIHAWGAEAASSSAQLARSALQLSSDLMSAIRSAIEILAAADADNTEAAAALEVLADAEASALPPSTVSASVAPTCVLEPTL